MQQETRTTPQTKTELDTSARQTWHAQIGSPTQNAEANPDTTTLTPYADSSGSSRNPADDNPGTDIPGHRGEHIEVDPNDPNADTLDATAANLSRAQRRHR